MNASMIGSINWSGMSSASLLAKYRKKVLGRDVGGLCDLFDGGCGVSVGLEELERLAADGLRVRIFFRSRNPGG